MEEEAEKGPCFKCGQEGQVRKTVFLEHRLPMSSEEPELLGRFKLAFCHACLREAIDKKKKGVLAVRIFGAAALAIAAAIAWNSGASKAAWIGLLAFAALIGISAGIKIRNPRALQADVLDDPLPLLALQWGVRPPAREPAGNETAAEFPLTEEGVVAASHPEITRIKEFTCDKCGRSQHTKPGYRWPLIAYRCVSKMTVTATTRIRISEPKPVVVDMCSACMIGEYKDIYRRTLRTAGKKARPLYATEPGSSASEGDVHALPLLEFERLVSHMDKV